LIDFGAVKEAVTTVLDSHGSASSIVIGTPGYMPLEQAAGRPAYASDLYSLALTAIVALTGKGPRDLVDRATGEIEWRPYAPATSPALASVLDRAIEPRSRDRFRTAEEMLDALRGATVPLAPDPKRLIVPTPPVFGPNGETIVEAVSPRDWTGTVVEERSEPPTKPRATETSKPFPLPARQTAEPLPYTAIACAILFALAATISPMRIAISGLTPLGLDIVNGVFHIGLVGYCAILLGNQRRHAVVAAGCGVVGALTVTINGTINRGLILLLFIAATVLAAMCWRSAARAPRRVVGATATRYLVLGLSFAAASILVGTTEGQISEGGVVVLPLLIVACGLACIGGWYVRGPLVLATAIGTGLGLLVAEGSLSLQRNKQALELASLVEIAAFLVALGAFLWERNRRGSVTSISSMDSTRRSS
jgi:hypothetical protein